jgi:hypothetical protein
MPADARRQAREPRESMTRCPRQDPPVPGGGRHLAVLAVTGTDPAQQAHSARTTDLRGLCAPGGAPSGRLPAQMRCEPLPPLQQHSKGRQATRQKRSQDQGQSQGQSQGPRSRTKSQGQGQGPKVKVKVKVKGGADRANRTWPFLRICACNCVNLITGWHRTATAAAAGTRSPALGPPVNRVGPELVLALRRRRIGRGRDGACGRLAGHRLIL